MGTQEEVVEKLAELARLCQDFEPADDFAGIFENSLGQLNPKDRGTLMRVFGSAIRRDLLRVFREACADHSVDSEARSVERITNEELVALVARLFRQFLDIESAVVGIAVDFTKGTHPRLPGRAADLKGHTLQLLRNGGDDAVESINDYLGDINQWMAAILTAWADAPVEWWKEWWGKIKPGAIEENAQVGLWANKYRRYWADFCELVRDLDPIGVEPQLLEVAAKLAIERHRKQKGGK